MKQKREADKKTVEESFHVGDRVWLYVPAVKQGQCKKLFSLWRGLYTIIDKVSAVNFRIQLIGRQQKRTVHKNRLKLCRSDPAGTGQQQPLDLRTDNEGNAGFVVVGADDPNGREEEGEREDPINIEGDIAEMDNIQNDTENVGEELTRRYPDRGRRPPDRYQAGFS